MSVMLLYKPEKSKNEKFANEIIAKAGTITEIKKAVFDKKLNVCQEDINLYHIYKNACKKMISTDYSMWVEVERLVYLKLQEAINYFNNVPFAKKFYVDMTLKVLNINKKGLDPEKVLTSDNEANYFLLVETVRDLKDFVKEINEELDKELCNKKYRASNVFEKMCKEKCIKSLKATPVFYVPKLENENIK